MANTFINTNDIRDAAITAAKLGVPTTTPTASKFAGWDANVNMSSNSFIGGYATTATASGTTTLTVASAYQQWFTGTLSQTIVLPVTSTLVLGQQFMIVNKSTASSITVNSSGGNGVTNVFTGWAVIFTCILTSGTTAASWSIVTMPLFTVPQANLVPYSGANQSLNMGTNSITTTGFIVQNSGDAIIQIRNSGDTNNWVKITLTDNGSTPPYEWLTFRFKQQAFSGGPTIDTLVLDGSGKSTFNYAGIVMQDSTAQLLNFVTVATMTTPWTWTYPDNPGTNDGDVLATDASGTTRWVDLKALYLRLDGTNTMTDAIHLHSNGIITAGTTSGAVTIKSTTGTYTLTLPTTAGTANYFLQTNGSGVTTWAAAPSGSGVTGALAKWSSSSALTNSILTESGNVLTNSGALGTNTIVNGLEFINTTASTNTTTFGYSPALYFQGTSWHTSSGGGSHNMAARIYMKGTSGSTAGTGKLVFEANSNGGTFFEFMNFGLFTGLINFSQNATFTSLITSNYSGPLIFGASNGTGVKYISLVASATGGEAQFGAEATGGGTLWPTSPGDYCCIRHNNGFAICTSGPSGTTQFSMDTNGHIILTGTLKYKSYTVATLPTVGTAGRRAYVTDATTPTFGATVVGGGSVVIPVFDNGTNWITI